MSDLPQDKETLSKWLKQKWDEKETLLREYYSQPATKRSFVKDPTTSPLALQLAATNRKYLRYQTIATISWLSFLVFVVYTLVSIWWWKWFTVLGIVFWLVITRFGGVDSFERKLHLK